MSWFTSCFGGNRVKDNVAKEAGEKANAQPQTAVLNGRNVVQNDAPKSKEQLNKEILELIGNKKLPLKKKIKTWETILKAQVIFAAQQELPIALENMSKQLPKEWSPKARQVFANTFTEQGNASITKLFSESYNTLITNVHNLPDRDKPSATSEGVQALSIILFTELFEAIESAINKAEQKGEQESSHP